MEYSLVCAAMYVVHTCDGADKVWTARRDDWIYVVVFAECVYATRMIGTCKIEEFVSFREDKFNCALEIRADDSEYTLYMTRVLVDMRTSIDCIVHMLELQNLPVAGTASMCACELGATRRVAAKTANELYLMYVDLRFPWRSGSILEDWEIDRDGIKFRVRLNKKLELSDDDTECAGQCVVAALHRSTNFIHFLNELQSLLEAMCELVCVKSGDTDTTVIISMIDVEHADFVGFIRSNIRRPIQADRKYVPFVCYDDGDDKYELIMRTDGDSH